MSDDFCVCDYDSPSVYRVKTVTAARKQHKCSECFGVIRVGEKYENVFGVWDNPDTFKTCARCLDLREFVKANVPCFCWAHGNMIQDAMDTADYYHEQGNGLLFGAHRRKVVIQRAKKMTTPPASA